MLMSLPITIPSARSASNSPSSEESIPPRTSPSPTMSKPDQTAQVLQAPQQEQDQANTNNAPTATMGANNTTNAKRKPSRRANIAERRATHNAVERQRRETLHGRFLDLGALLPNLSRVRRPSKSSIVDSSIALIHASRRHCLLAARELRLLKLESDALRSEVNEWRNRAGISILEEPVRSEDFSMVISGELGVIAGVQAEEEDEGMAYGGFDGEGDGSPVASQTSTISNAGLDGLPDPRVEIFKIFPRGVPAQQAHYNSGNDLHLAHLMSCSVAQGPMIASPTAVAFENHISRISESNINDNLKSEDGQNYRSLTGYHRRNDGSHASYTPHTRSRPESKDTHVAFPSRKSPMSIVSSPSQSDSDSRPGANATKSPHKRRRMSTDSASEPSSSPASYGSFGNFSNMSSVTSNSIRSFVDYPCSNYSSWNGGSSSPNAQSNTFRNWSNSNSMAETSSNGSNWPSPMAANENRSRPGSAQSGSSGGRSDSP